jgi:hypothetical protein
MVAYTVVKQLTSTTDAKKKMKADRKRRRNRARPNMRGPRAIYPHDRALAAIYTNFLDQAALYGPTFKSYFRLSRPRVQLLMEVLAGSGDPYYVTTVRFGVTGPSLEARILLPLRTLAYGVADHTFCPCFSMAITTAKTCCREFNRAITKYFAHEFLRLPSPADLKSISDLHLRVHGVPGMLGSLDCMHTYWKNCPVAWQGSFQGRDKGKSTIILEAVADHCLWFWHASYGYSGALNDLNVLTLSPLMRRITDGSFTVTESHSGVVPFFIGDTTPAFDKMFMLVDGIYPSYSRFIRGFKEPVTDEECAFTSWQEGARKDVERAFGVLQGKWKSVATPIQTVDPKYIASMVSCCLILHNMGVSDRVMGDVRTWYDPGSVVEQQEVEEQEDGDETGSMVPQGGGLALQQVATSTTIRAFDIELARVITQRQEMKGLTNEAECIRLQKALISCVNGWKSKN